MWDYYYFWELCVTRGLFTKSSVLIGRLRTKVILALRFIVMFVSIYALITEDLYFRVFDRMFRTHQDLELKAHAQSGPPFFALRASVTAILYGHMKDSKVCRYFLILAV